VKHPSEVVKKGQVIQAVILNIDAPGRRLSLGVKQLQPDGWETFFRTHQMGDVVKGKVTRAAAFGIFVEILPGVEGLCHRSEILPEYGKKTGDSGGTGDFPGVPVGQEFAFKIIKLNEAQKRIGLSQRAITEDDERSRLQQYNRQAAAATSTVGHALKQNRWEDSRYQEQGQTSDDES
jgi:small subunit ribosomal protein S1